MFPISLTNNWFASRLLREAEGADGGSGVNPEETPVGGGTPDAGSAPAAPPSALDGSPEASTETETSPETEDTSEDNGEAVAFDPASLTLPEGAAIADETMTAFAGVLNNPDLSPQERGQQLMDLYASEMSAVSEASLASWNQMNDEWAKSIRTLPEFSANPDAELGAVKQALIAQGATEDFFSAMNLTGAGNNPHVLQMLHKLTQPYREGGGVGGGATPPRARSSAETMFPTMKPQG